jgi:hypothetical protein
MCWELERAQQRHFFVCELAPTSGRRGPACAFCQQTDKIRIRAHYQWFHGQHGSKTYTYSNNTTRTATAGAHVSDDILPVGRIECQYILYDRKTKEITEYRTTNAHFVSLGRLQTQKENNSVLTGRSSGLYRRNFIISSPLFSITIWFMNDGVYNCTISVATTVE